MHGSRRLSATVAACLGGVLSATGCTDDVATVRRPSSVLLLSLDTVRADHLGLYGYERRTSPNLERFARGATRFERAHTTAPWTLPAHASLFTGLYPPEHGSQMIRLEPGARPERALPLDPDLTTLAEVLQGAGYATAGVAANYLYFATSYRLDQGFDHWEVLEGRVGVSAAPAPEVNRRALAWLDGQASQRPFFLFLNYMDAHTPYNTAPRDEFPGHHVSSFSPRQHAETEAIVLGGRGAVPRQRIRTVVDQYDLAIANLDAGLGALFAELAERGLLDDALVVVVSDHGEFLGERRLLGHAKDVYEGTMGVPLIVKRPGQKTGEVDERLISLVHVPRLVLEAVGLEGVAPDGAFPHDWPAPASFGQNRYSLWVDMARPWRSRFDRVREVLYRGDLKLIHSSDGRHELYDLARDPEEANNLLVGSPALRDRWLDEMKALRPSPDPTRTARGAGEAEPLSEEELDKLRTLGYVE